MNWRRLAREDEPLFMDRFTVRFDGPDGQDPDGHIKAACALMPDDVRVYVADTPWNGFLLMVLELDAAGIYACTKYLADPEELHGFDGSGDIEEARDIALELMQYGF